MSVNFELRVLSFMHTKAKASAQLIGETVDLIMTLKMKAPGLHWGTASAVTTPRTLLPT